MDLIKDLVGEITRLEKLKADSARLLASIASKQGDLETGKKESVHAQKVLEETQVGYEAAKSALEQIRANRIETPHKNLLWELMVKLGKVGAIKGFDGAPLQLDVSKYVAYNQQEKGFVEQQQTYLKRTEYEVKDLACVVIHPSSVEFGAYAHNGPSKKVVANYTLKEGQRGYVEFVGFASNVPRPYYYHIGYIAKVDYIQIALAVTGAIKPLYDSLPQDIQEVMDKIGKLEAFEKLVLKDEASIYEHSANLQNAEVKCSKFAQDISNGKVQIKHYKNYTKDARQELDILNTKKNRLKTPAEYQADIDAKKAKIVVIAQGAEGSARGAVAQPSFESFYNMLSKGGSGGRGKWIAALLKESTDKDDFKRAIFDPSFFAKKIPYFSGMVGGYEVEGTCGPAWVGAKNVTESASLQDLFVRNGEYHENYFYGDVELAAAYVKCLIEGNDLAILAKIVKTPFTQHYNEPVVGRFQITNVPRAKQYSNIFHFQEVWNLLTPEEQGYINFVIKEVAPNPTAWKAAAKKCDAPWANKKEPLDDFRRC